MQSPSVSMVVTALGWSSVVVAGCSGCSNKESNSLKTKPQTCAHVCVYLRSSGDTWGRAWPRTSRQVEPSPAQTPQLSSLALLPSCLSQPTSCWTKQRHNSDKRQNGKLDLDFKLDSLSTAAFWIEHFLDLTLQLQHYFKRKLILRETDLQDLNQQIMLPP